MTPVPVTSHDADDRSRKDESSSANELLAALDEERRRKEKNAPDADSHQMILDPVRFYGKKNGAYIDPTKAEKGSNMTDIISHKGAIEFII